MASPSSSNDAKDLAHTIRSVYGDLLDLPILRTGEAISASSAPRAANASEALASFAEEIRYCQECIYHGGRRHLVFGRGDPQSAIAFVGDFPSNADDENATPFSDEAGELLHKMILAMKLRPEEVYLTNLSKCRPPTGARPEEDRFLHEEEHLQRQFGHLQARVIVALGDVTARTLAHSESPLPVLRRQIFDWNGRQVFCTHHPRDLLKNPAKKKEAWEDLQSVMRALYLQ